MPTTTSTATIARNDLVKRAFRRIGIDHPSINQINDAVSLLNDIVKEIDTEGRWLWAISSNPSPLLLVPSQRWYTAGVGASLIQPNIMVVEWAEVIQGTSLRPLQIITELEAISNIQREAVGGQPYYVYLERNAVKANQRMGFFPTPMDAYATQYTFRRQLYDFLNPTDNPDFPQDWAIALAKRLSFEMAAENGIPLQERAKLEQEANDAMRKRMAANSETPTPRPQRSQYF